MHEKNFYILSRNDPFATLLSIKIKKITNLLRNNSPNHISAPNYSNSL